MKDKLAIKGPRISKSVAKRLKAQIGKDSPRQIKNMKRVRPTDELEIEKRQREQLTVRFAGRKPSPFSAEVDLMAASDSWRENYGAIREQESFDSNKNVPSKEKERENLKKLLVDAGVEIVRLREAIEKYIETPMVFHTILCQEDMKEFYKRTRWLVDALGEGNNDV